jgi:monoamine oxidase
MTEYDIAIVGAGLAGAAAAWKLTQGGRSVIVLEARDRIGGRALTRSFAAGGELLEFGGSWITPWQQRIRYYADLMGIALRPRLPIIEHRWHDGATLRIGSPCAEADLPAFERAMARIKSDAERYERGEGSELASVPFNAYLDRIAASPAARVHAMAWWTISGNGDPDRISAAEFLSSAAYGGGRPEGMVNALAHTLVPGAGVLAERMISRSGAECRLNAPVARIADHSRRVVLAHSDGTETRARCVALCLPLNALRSIDFSPPLPRRKADAAAIGHGGRSIKLWIKVRGARTGTLATGGPHGLRWMFAEREGLAGNTLIVGFALADDQFDPESRHDVEDGLHRLFPEADLVAWDWHDWVGDPWARGTWVALPADALWIADSGLWAPEGRLAFASSDYASQSPGWFEAAIVAGEAAAHALLERNDLFG